MRRWLILMICLFGWTAVSTSLHADIEKTFLKKSYPGSENRDYIVHLPAGYDEHKPGGYPVVMVLHGCHQTNETIRQGTGFNALADAEGFIVVYPYITNYPAFPMRNTDCWGYWIDDHKHRGAGEPADLANLMLEVAGDYNGDPDRLHVTGLSSGAGMTTIVLVAYPEVFASGATVAGLAYDETSSTYKAGSCPMDLFPCMGYRPPEESAASMDAEMGTRKRLVPVFTVHSEDDCSVWICSSKNIRDSFGIAFGFDTNTPIATDTGSKDGISWTHKKYGTLEGYPSNAEAFFVSGTDSNPGNCGNGHCWMGGADSGSWCMNEGPDISLKIWDFFANHAKTGNRPPDLTINSVTAHTDLTITVTGSATDPDGTIDRLDIRFTGDNPVGSVDITSHMDPSTGDFSYTTPALSNGFWYTPQATAFDDQGAVTEVTGDPVEVGNAAPNVVIDHAGSSGDTITVDITATDSGSVTSVEVKIGSDPWAGAMHQGGNAWRFTGSGYADGTYSLQVRATDNDGGVTTVSGPDITVQSWTCVEHTSSNYHHVQAGRATTNGWYCYDSEGNNMGLYNVFYHTTLAEVSEGYYIIGHCE